MCRQLPKYIRQQFEVFYIDAQFTLWAPKLRRDSWYNFRSHFHNSATLCLAGKSSTLGPHYHSFSANPLSAHLINQTIWATATSCNRPVTCISDPPVTCCVFLLLLRVIPHAFSADAPRSPTPPENNFLRICQSARAHAFNIQVRCTGSFKQICIAGFSPPDFKKIISIFSAY